MWLFLFVMHPCIAIMRCLFSNVAVFCIHKLLLPTATVKNKGSSISNSKNQTKSIPDNTHTNILSSFPCAVLAICYVFSVAVLYYIFDMCYLLLVISFCNYFLLLFVVSYLLLIFVICYLFFICGCLLPLLVIVTFGGCGSVVV